MIIFSVILLFNPVFAISLKIIDYKNDLQVECLSKIDDSVPVDFKNAVCNNASNVSKRYDITDPESTEEEDN